MYLLMVGIRSVLLFDLREASGGRDEGALENMDLGAGCTGSVKSH